MLLKKFIQYVKTCHAYLLASLVRIRNGERHGYMFLGAVTLLHFYLKVINMLHPEVSADVENHNWSFPATAIDFQEGLSKLPDNGPKNREVHFLVPTNTAETRVKHNPLPRTALAEGAAYLNNAILIDGGRSIVHNGYYVKGRWQEQRLGVTSLEMESDFHEHARKLLLPTTDLERVKGLSLCMTGPWSFNYFHWLLQYLPILQIIGSYCTIDSIDNFLITEPILPFQIESLRLFGIPTQKIIRVQDMRPVIAERLLLTPIPCPNYDYQPWVIHFLRGLAQSNDYDHGPIFLDRPAPSKRHIVNAEEVYSILESYGVRRVDCSTLSFSDQIQLASSSRFLLGIHGASLVNCVFASPASTLLELLPRNYRLPYFSRLAAASGLHYLQLLGIEPGPLPFQPQIQDSDMIVPIKRLQRILDIAQRNYPWR